MLTYKSNYLISIILIWALSSFDFYGAQSVNMITISTGSDTMNGLVGVTVDTASGNLIISDTKNHAIKSVSSTGNVTTLIGSAQDTSLLQDPRTAPESLLFPMGTALDGDGNILIADYGRHSIKKLSIVTREVSIIAGDVQGYLDGANTVARFNFPTSLTVDSTGNIYIADFMNHRIRKISIDTGITTTFAGSGVAGFQDGTGSNAKFNNPTGLIADFVNHAIYVTDFTNHAIRKIIMATGGVETLAGSGVGGYQDAIGTVAQFRNPYGVALANSNSILYVSDYGNNLIRKIDMSTRTVDTLVIGNISFPQLRKPAGIAVNSQGSVYIADSGNNQIRKIIICAQGSEFYATDAACVIPGDINCPLGEEPIRFRTQCAQCQSGWFRPSFDMTQCIRCPIGAFCTATNIKCGYGYTNSKTIQFACEKCADGFIKTIVNNVDCAPCLGGTYSNKNNTDCLLCPKGTFKPSALNQCDKCLIGFESNPARTACTPCKSPKYYRPTMESDECIECPEGAYCSTVDFKCKDGYEVNASGKGCLQLKSNSANDSVLGLSVFEITVIAIGIFVLTAFLGLYVLYKNRLGEIKENKRKMNFYEFYSKQAELTSSKTVLNHPFSNSSEDIRINPTPSMNRAFSNRVGDLQIKISPTTSVYNSQQTTPVTQTIPQQKIGRWSISLNI